jgi:Holliday junction resolvase-like predicted endonuclease
METRRYPVDTQTFSTVIENKCVYIDKTALVYKMAKEYRYVFLSRPRRFGKSLLCSTLDEYFNGNKDLFKGLKIETLEKDWIKYPVLNFSFAKAKTNNLDVFRASCELMLQQYETKFNIPIIKDGLNNRLLNIVIQLHEKFGQKVVIIIDEYDAPMLNAIDNDAFQNQIREIQYEFFSPLKDLDPHIRFVFLTGITKFSQMSIFSALNNLKDISLLPEFETICGISKDEFLTTLKPDIQNFADKNGYTFDNTVKYFKNKYDGYHFSSEMQNVFNPYSVINALNDKKLNDYWFDSGTPSSLLKLINKFDIQMEDYDGVECSASRFNKPVEKVTDLVPFLFQAGYLTIKDYKSEIDEDSFYETYTLSYPNGEVRFAFANCLFTDFYKVHENIVLRDAYIAFKKDDNIDNFIKHLKVFFDAFPFSLNNQNEKHYHSILYTLLTSFGANISANVETALGKADLILKMPKTIYVIELKYDRSVESAKRQIAFRRYAKAYFDEGKKVVKLAIKFSSKDRNIESYKIGIKNS